MIVGFSLLAYFLSPPIVLWGLSKFYSFFFQAPPWVVQSITVFYAPIGWLCNHSQTLSDFYAAYLHMMVDPMFMMMG